MTDLKSILLEHLSSHPQAEVPDAAKLIYQNEFGGGHLVTDPDEALRRLRRELEDSPHMDEPLSEPIGGGLARLNLRPASGRLSAETMARIFVLSSQRPRGSAEGLEEKLPLLYELGFDRASVAAFLRDYSGSMLSHSERYRAAYAPSYRVVEEKYIKYLDIFSAIDRLSRFAGPIVAAIDGMCASGKTTLAGMLAGVYDANVFHADDYFLPPQARTPERLGTPGGNMDRERLAREVLLPLSRDDAAVTRRFDCGSSVLLPPVVHERRRVNIVEGSYCLHPDLQDFYTLKLALRTTPERQAARLARRDPESLPRFKAMWIPMENEYFEATCLFDRADMVVDT